MLNKIIERCNCCITDNIYINEMQTKTSIILPFFQYLGYDTEDFFTFKAEYSCGRERVDYAVLKDEKVEILIETKKINENLNNHVSQIAKYMKYHKQTKIGVLTNGLEYRFYKRGDKGLIEVWRLNLLFLNDNDMSLINQCHYKDLTILEDEDIIKYSRLDLTIKSLFENPKDDLINLVKEKSNLNDIKDWAVQAYLMDYLKPKKAEKIKKNQKNIEKKDYTLESSYKSFLSKGFTKEEALWLTKYKVDNNFDLYLSIRFYFNRSLFSKRNFKLSKVMNDYACRDIKISQHLKNNEKIFASISNKLLPEIIFKCDYIDDLSNKKKPIHINNINKVAI